MRRFPEPGEKAMAIRQPTHTKEYALGFSGTIPEGYGAGKVKLRKSEPIEVQEANEKHVRFNVYGGKVPEQFLLKRMGNRWMLMNITPRRSAQRWQKLLGGGKEQMKETHISGVGPGSPGIMQPKVDGASAFVVLEGGRPPRVFSYREAKNKTGLIEHTHKFKNWWKPTAPGLKTTVVRAEVFARDSKGRTAPPQITGGILNAGVLKSRQKQLEQGLQLDLRTFKAERFQGKGHGSQPYESQLQALDAVHKADSRMKPMPTARTPKEKQRLLSDILSGKNKLTSEGVVLRDPSGRIIKAKQRPDFDVYVREITKGKARGEAGAFRYSLTPKGPIVGNVGTGFSHQLRRQMLRNPNAFIGRAAKVIAQQKFPSGALRAPVFTGEWHLDKGRQPGVEQ